MSVQELKVPGHEVLTVHWAARLGGVLFVVLSVILQEAFFASYPL